jgi:predicted MFS family arabinose efflux permease
MDMQKSQALSEWRVGWPLILTGLSGTTCVGAHVYPLGTVMKPLAAAYGWSRAEISSGATISSIVTLLLATLVGVLLDRYGPRRVALVGTPLCAGVISLVTFAGPSIWSWYAIWTLYALVVVLILPIVWGKAIAGAFHKTRGLALAVGLSGSGVSAALYPPLTLWLLDTYGIRGVYPGLGLFILVALGPLVLFAFKPRAIVAEPSDGEADAATVAWGVPLREAMRTTLLWRIVLVLGMAAVTASAINVHLQPLLTDRGLTPVQAASIAAALGPSVLFGRWLGGALLDRFHARWITLAFYVLPAAGCLLLLQFDGTYLRGLAGTVMIGLSVGVEGDLLPFLLARYFGLRFFGTLFGFGMAVFGAGYALGPALAGLLFDRTGSYDIGLMTLAGGLVIAAVVALTYGRYPDAEEGPAPRAGLNPTPREAT